MPNPTSYPFSPVSASATRSTPSAENDGYAPYSQQWNINVQRELPYNMFVTAAWVGNRVIHLPSQNNGINQMNPTYDASVWGRMLADVVCDWLSIRLDGVCICPMRTSCNDFGGSATVAQALRPIHSTRTSSTTLKVSAQPTTRAPRSRSKSASPTACPSWRVTRSPA